MEDDGEDRPDARAEAFFEQVGGALDSFAADAVKCVRDPEDAADRYRAAYTTLSAALTTTEQLDAFELAVRDALSGLGHSIMYALDGGSEDAPQLLHADGTPFPGGLNEWFIAHLLDTGRIP